MSSFSFRALTSQAPLVFEMWTNFFLEYRRHWRQFSKNWMMSSLIKLMASQIKLIWSGKWFKVKLKFSRVSSMYLVESSCSSWIKSKSQGIIKKPVFLWCRHARMVLGNKGPVHDCSILIEMENNLWMSASRVHSHQQHLWTSLAVILRVFCSGDGREKSERRSTWVFFVRLE